MMIRAEDDDCMVATRAAHDYLTLGIRSVEIERDGVLALERALRGELGERFVAAIELFLAGDRRVVFTGIGKSGHIARKICATFSSTGAPAYFLHAAEANHGDLGLLSPGDMIIVVFSWSGETHELANILEYAVRFEIPIIAVTGRADSTVGRVATVTLELPTVEEACPNGLAPTTSTTMQLVLGDALATTLLKARGFSATDFRTFHPGGKLGAKLRPVSDLMHVGDEIPLVTIETPVADLIIEMSSKRFGAVGVVDAAGKLAGIVTDGDLRRTLGPDILDLPAGEIMTADPHAVAPTVIGAEALALMNRHSITVLFVTRQREVQGIVHVHDLLRAGIS
jgi:arabinose-5-phosphate isomerase